MLLRTTKQLAWDLLLVLFLYFQSLHFSQYDIHTGCINVKLKYMHFRQKNSKELF